MTQPVMQINPPPGFIDLGLGDPPLNLLPMELLRRAALACFSHDDPAFLQYGTEQGNGYFRLALAEFLSRGYGIPVDSANLFITTGASSALDLVCTLYTVPGDLVFVEDPTYFLALRIFADHHLQVASVPTDDDGLVITSLESALEINHPKFLYIIPAYQNPSGVTLSLARRQQLVDLCIRHGVRIVADEVYHLLSYSNPPPSPMAGWIDAGNVLSLGSFSKILAPGLRLGWIQSDPATIRDLIRCGLLDSGGGMNPFTSAIIHELISHGDLDDNISRLKRIYSQRLQAMDKFLRHHLPQATYTLPTGGYFIWLRLPGIDSSKLQEQAKSQSLGLRAGCKFSSKGGFPEHLRLGFIHYPDEQIEQGILRLKDCLLEQV